MKRVSDLSADVTIALGGKNKKTGKDNPTNIKGYLLGKRVVESKKAKSGFCNIYVLQTPKGSIGVWGKTDMDRKMTAVPLGALVEITHSGFVPTPNGDMYKYNVDFDPDDVVEVTGQEAGGHAESDGKYTDESVDETSYEEASIEDEEADQAAALALLQREARVKELLKGKRPKTA